MTPADATSTKYSQAGGGAVLENPGFWGTILIGLKTVGALTLAGVAGTLAILNPASNEIDPAVNPEIKNTKQDEPDPAKPALLPNSNPQDIQTDTKNEADDSQYIYRGMRPQVPTNFPRIGNTANDLGVRVGTDVVVGSDGFLDLNAEDELGRSKDGMSTNIDPKLVPEFRRPPKNPKNAVWKIKISDLPTGLMVRFDGPEFGPGHATIKPAYPMTLQQYQSLLNETQSLWELETKPDKY